MTAMDEPPTDLRPTGITHDRQGHQLLIAWNDGHESVYPLDVLRAICPCVSCRGGHDKMGPQHEPDILTLTPTHSYELRDMQLVGHYALQLWWDDGHNSGIYTWSLLRRNCACDACLAGRAARSG
jgi:DUF971 family protein